MIQLPVTKQGKILSHTFNDRLATFDSTQRCVFLSRKHHPEELWHHKFIVHEVKLWPEFNALLVDEGFNTKKAMLTVQVKGVESAPTHQDIIRVLSCSQRCPCDRSTDADPAAYPSEKLTHTGVAVKAAAPASSSDGFSAMRFYVDETNGKRGCWILRSSSLASFEKLLEAFHLLQAPDIERVLEAESATEASEAAGDTPLPHITGDVDLIRDSVRLYNHKRKDRTLF